MTIPPSSRSPLFVEGKPAPLAETRAYLFSLQALSFAIEHALLPRSRASKRQLSLFADNEIIEGFAVLRERFSTQRLFPLSPPPFFAGLKHCAPEGSEGRIESLSGLLESVTQRETVVREGIIYTPHEIAASMVGEAFALFEEAEGRTPASTLDPAVGGGIFLLEAFRRLLDREKGADIEEILGERLFGIDKDPLAVEASRVLLLLESSVRLKRIVRCPAGLLERIAVADALLDPLPFPTMKDGFELVIGNPPYGLARGEKLTEEENQRLRRRYASWRFGKVNKYLAFMARGCELVSPKGVCSLIVPNAWLGVASALELRKRVLEEGMLRRVVIYEDKVFAEPSIEPVTFYLKKGRPSSEFFVERVHRLKGRREEARIPVDLCRRAPDLVIPTRWRDGAGALFQLLDETTVPLADPKTGFLPLIALQAYATGKGTPKQSPADVRNHVYHSSKPLDETYLKYLEGGDVKPFTTIWSGRYLRYGPWLAEYQDIERYRGPRVALREITFPLPYLLAAAALEEPAVYNKSVLHIVSSERSEEMMDRMLALSTILNSKLASAVLLFRGRKTQRKLFPKIVNEDLKSFPLPHSFTDSVPELASLAKEVKNLLDDGRPVEKLRSTADHLVLEAYGRHADLTGAIEDALR